jgi:predicted regulator of Ras-like GTPase activity (Roadblock/LC7/MglB family)
MPRKKALQVEVEEPLDVKAEVKEDIGADLRTALERINTQEGVIGYILRGPTSASVDIKDPRRIIDYAVLSTAAFESSESLSRLFELGKIRNVVLEGKDVKIFCLTIGDHRLSVFMEKTVDHNSIYKKLTQP